MADLELRRVEYRIKPVTRYIVTKFEAWNYPPEDKCAQADETHVVELGEYANADMAWEVGYALAKQRHELIGWPLDDDRIRYPNRPGEVECIRPAREAKAIPPKNAVA